MAFKMLTLARERQKITSGLLCKMSTPIFSYYYWTRMLCSFPRFHGSAPSLCSLFSYLSYCIYLIYPMIYIGLENQTVEKANQIIYLMCIFIWKLTALSMMYRWYLAFLILLTLAFTGSACLILRNTFKILPRYGCNVYRNRQFTTMQNNFAGKTCVACITLDLDLYT